MKINIKKNPKEPPLVREIKYNFTSFHPYPWWSFTYFFISRYQETRYIPISGYFQLKRVFLGYSWISGYFQIKRVFKEHLGISGLFSTQKDIQSVFGYVRVFSNQKCIYRVFWCSWNSGILGFQLVDSRFGKQWRHFTSFIPRITLYWG